MAGSKKISFNERKQFQEMELLLRVAKQVAVIDTLDELLSTIVEITAKETDADRGTLFLNDDQTSELYSRVALGNRFREIRILNTEGIAGSVFTKGEGAIVQDAYADPRFDRTIDEETGYVTKNVLCAPIRTVKGEVIGVLQMLNRKNGEFTAEDLRLLEAMTRQTAITLRNHQFVESMKVSRVAMGDKVGEIRMPNHLGIAGAVFTSGETVNIPHAYADLRFNPAFDKRTGYFTRSILCVPIANKAGKIIGVTQVLNKRGGPFTQDDEARLKAFTAQLAISLENAKLFDDVQNIKNYNESMLQSMSNGVVTMNEDGRIVTCNVAGLRILRVKAQDISGRPAAEFFTGPNAWILDKIKMVEESMKSDISMDALLTLGNDKVSVNLTALPLMAQEE